MSCGDLIGFVHGVQGEKHLWAASWMELVGNRLVFVIASGTLYQGSNDVIY